MFSVPGHAPQRSVRPLGWMILACATGFVAAYILVVRTPVGQEFGDWALIGNAELAHDNVRRASRLLHYISGPVVALLALLLTVVALLRRRPRTALIGTGGFLCAVIAAELLKRILPRPRLDASWEQDLVDKTINTFPSGHATIVTAFVFALILVSAPRARVWIAFAGSVLVVMVAMGVVIAGWHRPEDSVGGVLLAAVAIGATSIVLVRRRVIEPLVGRGLVVGLCAAAVSSACIALVLLARREGAMLPSGVEAYAFPVAVATVAVVCFSVVQLGSSLLCVPGATSHMKR